MSIWQHLYAEPDIGEIISTILNLKNVKAAAEDGIPGELMKAVAGPMV